VSSGDPCGDDGLFCTGVESCDEDNDACVSSGDPCGDDGLFCNGVESCDEDNDTCVSSGDPCGDDGLFCNGVESCDEDNDVCVSTGDPCTDDGNPCTTETCNEDADECLTSNVPPGDGECTDGDDCTSYTGEVEGDDACNGDGDCVGIPVDCEFSISTSFSGPNVEVTILLQTLGDGSGVAITVDVTDSTLIGDIQGVFFHVNDENKLLPAVTITGDDVTSFQVGPANQVQNLGNGATMSGDRNRHKYDIGVRIGTAGIGVDDIQTTTFIVTGFTTADFTSEEEFGVRLTSVGPEGGNRGQSSKVYGNHDCSCPVSLARRQLHGLIRGF